MRNVPFYIALAATIGPLFLAGTLFVPPALLLLGVQQQVVHKERGVAPGMWIAGLAAVITAIFIYGGHADAVAKCDSIAARPTFEYLDELFGTDSRADQRMDMIEAGCNSLPFYEMPDY
ncbi:hypothetical protein GCM10022200_10850 [Microbacterium awajiense]|uniref:DUF4190 domain-containing protein n=1 Tax=Microbacterium awajiense TaxID=415214 RepID=A0ABP7ADK8_9MICO